jgi:hypothetical protein
MSATALVIGADGRELAVFCVSRPGGERGPCRGWGR